MNDECKLEVGKSYPAVLRDVIWEYDHVRSVYKVKFKYLVYLSPTETVEVEDVFYWWSCPRYRGNTMNKILRISEIYDIRLTDRDYRNEIAFSNAFKWLIDTRVEISPYRYKGKKYKVVCSERNNCGRIQQLWSCLKENGVDNSSYRFKHNDEKREQELKTVDGVSNEERKLLIEQAIKKLNESMRKIRKQVIEEHGGYNN